MNDIEAVIASGPPTGARSTIINAITWPGGVRVAPRYLNGAVTLTLLVFAAVWLWHLADTSLSPPVDNIEQLNWVASLEWGYYKHPPLPTWLLWLPVHVFGASAWTSYGLGAACTLTAMGLFWRLLLMLRGPAYATVALLAALCITYYNGRLYYYNHNVVLMLLSTACAWLCWKAFTTRRLTWWIALGVALGLGALTKYQIAVTLACIVTFALHQRAWRDPKHRLGALLAILVALLMFTPHVLWLRTHDFGPIGYAMESSLAARFDPAKRLVESSHWLVDQWLNRGLPALILLAVVGRPVWRNQIGAAARLGQASARAADPAHSLLLAWGLVPFFFMTLVGLLVGADLQLQWGTAFVLFAVPGAMELVPTRCWERVDLRKALTTFVLIQLLLLAISYVTSPRGPEGLRNRYWRTFDSELLAERIAAPARAALGGSVRVVIGSSAEAGALALRLPEHPRVLIDGRFDRSPWVNPQTLRSCGAVQLGRAAAMPNAHLLGSEFPGLTWTIVAPDKSAPACTGQVSAGQVSSAFPGSPDDSTLFGWPQRGTPSAW